LLIKRIYPQFDKVIKIIASQPKLPILILIGYFGMQFNSIITFYLLTAIVFTPKSIVSTYKLDLSELNSRKRTSWIITVLSHIIASIIIEVILIGFFIPNFFSEANDFSSIIIGLFTHNPAVRPLQSSIVFLFPFVLVLSWYFKHDFS